MSYGQPEAWRQHVCGLYFNTRPSAWQIEKSYLPMVELEAHATILATTSRTVLTQTFMNPSDEKGIKKVRYTFPLYDGVSVVSFTCHIGNRTIVGEVKEKEKARAVFKEAVARGETAGLLEQLPDASDVFSTTVGNVAPGARVIIKITYLGELKHDMEVDGIRYTIPNIICPRYGNYPGTLRTSDSTEGCGKSISITVDAEMAEESFIQRIQSPSHPIAMTMGTTSVAPRADPTMNKASASLTLGTSSLETDFVVQIIAKDISVPKAILEEHPTIPNHRALMATLVPKFALPAEKPEIVFVCDRSGSMGGTRINLTIKALKVFLRSLPVGVKFNICSFGWKPSFLWPQSMTYSQQSLDEATQHVASFSANFGGTEMLAPLKETINRRYKDMPLEVMLLTDGETWDQLNLFAYLNESVGQSKAPIRVFTLGIGNGVSHSLIEGIAKAGNGFSQTVGEGEAMETKVIRMLKGALSPHISDYTIEVKYGASPEMQDDDLEIVEKVADSLRVKLNLEERPEPKVQIFRDFKAMLTLIADNKQKKPISLFDTSIDLDKEKVPADDSTGEARYAHLPAVPVPKIIQAPQNIPALFAFNRTSVYLLLGPEAPSATPKSVMLRGTSTHGPLELEIPIQIVDTPGETVHQLAAKKAISELEQGRGWLSESKDEYGNPLKMRFEGKFPDMVEREAVRLGVQFQVGSKWCSFVAVESNGSEKVKEKKDTEDWEWMDDEKTEAVAAAQHSESPSYRSGSGRRDNAKYNVRLRDTTSENMHKKTMEKMNALKASQDATGNSTNFKPTTDASAQSQAQLQAQHAASKSGQATADIASSNTRDPKRGRGGVGLGKGGSNRSAARANFGGPPTQQKPSPSGTLSGGVPQISQSQTRSGKIFSSNPAQTTGGGLFGSSSAQSSGGRLFGGPSTPSANQVLLPPPSSGTALFGSALPAPAQSAADAKALEDYQSGLMVLHQDNKDRKHFAPAAATNPFASKSDASFASVQAKVDADSDSDGDMGFMLVDDENECYSAPATQSSAYSPMKNSTAPPPSLKDDPALWLHHVIALQSFSGAWEWDAKLKQVFKDLDISEKKMIALKRKRGEMDYTATAVVIVVLEEKLGSMKGSWELVVEKARGWLEDAGMKGLLEKAVEMVKEL